MEWMSALVGLGVLLVALGALAARAGLPRVARGARRCGAALLVIAVLWSFAGARVALLARQAWAPALPGVRDVLFVGAVLALAGVGYRHWARRREARIDGRGSQERARWQERRRLLPPAPIVGALGSGDAIEASDDAFAFRPRTHRAPPSRDE